MNVENFDESIQNFRSFSVLIFSVARWSGSIGFPLHVLTSKKIMRFISISKWFNSSKKLKIITSEIFKKNLNLNLNLVSLYSEEKMRVEAHECAIRNNLDSTTVKTEKYEGILHVLPWFINGTKWGLIVTLGSRCVVELLCKSVVGRILSLSRTIWSSHIRHSRARAWKL